MGKPQTVLCGAEVDVQRVVTGALFWAVGGNAVGCGAIGEGIAGDGLGEAVGDGDGLGGGNAFGDGDGLVLLEFCSVTDPGNGGVYLHS